MRFVAFFILFCFLSISGYNQKYTPALLNRLDSVIAAVPQYDQDKIKKINALHGELLQNPGLPLFDHYLELYKEYYIFNYDSAYIYARRMQQMAFPAKK